MRVERKAGEKAKYKTLADGRVSARAVRYSHNDGAPFSVTVHAPSGAAVRVLLTLDEAKQVARDLAEFMAGQSPDAFALRPESGAP